MDADSLALADACAMGNVWARAGRALREGRRSARAVDLHLMGANTLPLLMDADNPGSLTRARWGERAERALSRVGQPCVT